MDKNIINLKGNPHEFVGLDARYTFMGAGYGCTGG
jgi:hypothetical protein